jgi:DNA repair exonuclease SbcCD ATPase subunit
LIAKAEALSDATDWGETASQYRALMEEWKAAGRAPRDVEDALWARFRAAQEKFFSRRNKTFADRDAEFEANAQVKEKLLAEAEKLDPASGLDSAKAKMRSIQERWEAAGKVPRERIREFDSRLKAVEDKLKSAEDRHWRRTDPETSARVAQFRSRVDSYQAAAAKARAAGDERKAREADAQAKQWQEWLRTAESAVDS